METQCRRIHAEGDKGWQNTGDSMAINSPMVSYRNTDPELDESSFRVNKENKEIVSNMHKRHHR